MRVLEGEIYDVAVDIRAGLAHVRPLGRRDPVERNQPAALGAGWGSRTASTSGSRHIVTYKVDAAYDPRSERSVLWSDEGYSGSTGPGADKILSEKDARAPTRLKDIPRDLLPRMARARSAGRAGAGK